MTQRRTQTDRSITAAGLAHLLARLDADADRAAAEYERLRLMLVKFFDWRGAWSPDECADDTIDRLAASLERETTIGDVRRYAYGVARRVLLERLRRQAQTPIEGHPDLSSLHVASPGAEPSSIRECFRRCLDELPDESRALVLDYYVSGGKARIDNRRRLARSLAISDNTLRSRAHRIRHRLERCVQACMAAATTSRAFPTREGEDQ
jgi:DNA-directed RNA polymerase specialized sigma24 family protein